MNQTFPESKQNKKVLRIIFQSRDIYHLIDEKGQTYTGRISGKYANAAEELTDYPVVGDYVETVIHDKEKAVIYSLLPRTSLLTRKIAGRRHDQQPISSNVDTIFITMSLNKDFNLSRMERYLTIVWDSGANPVVILTKSDLLTEAELAEKISAIEAIAFGIPVITASIFEPALEEKFAPYLFSGQTVLFIGSSGVGKSTLTNRLLKSEQQSTGGIREDDAKGKHTTTGRHLLYTADGAAIIDTPGMREIGVEGASEEASAANFNDIEELARTCRFKDCKHEKEPGCTVRQAILSGSLTEKRLESYQTLLVESQYEGLNARQIEKIKMRRMFGTEKPKRLKGKK